MVPFVRSLRTKVRKLREPRPASAMAFAAVAVDGTDTYVTRPRDRASLLASALIHFASWLFPSSCQGKATHRDTQSPENTRATEIYGKSHTQRLVLLRTQHIAATRQPQRHRAIVPR